MAIISFMFDFAREQVYLGDERKMANGLSVKHRTIKRYMDNPANGNDDAKWFDTILNVFREKPEALKDALFLFDEKAPNGNTCAHAPAIQSAKRTLLLNMRKEAAKGNVDAVGFHGVAQIEAMEGVMCGLNPRKAAECKHYTKAPLDSEAGGVDENSVCPCAQMIGFSTKLYAMMNSSREPQPD